MINGYRQLEMPIRVGDLYRIEAKEGLVVWDYPLDKSVTAITNFDTITYSRLIVIICPLDEDPPSFKAKKGSKMFSRIKSKFGRIFFNPNMLTDDSNCVAEDRESTRAGYVIATSELDLYYTTEAELALACCII